MNRTDRPSKADRTGLNTLILHRDRIFALLFLFMSL